LKDKSKKKKNKTIIFKIKENKKQYIVEEKPGWLIDCGRYKYNSV